MCIFYMYLKTFRHHWLLNVAFLVAAYYHLILQFFVLYHMCAPHELVDITEKDLWFLRSDDECHLKTEDPQ